MDPTALYYALSTIAQCAAALAAFIGFLGYGGWTDSGRSWRRLKTIFGGCSATVGRKL